MLDPSKMAIGIFRTGFLLIDGWFSSDGYRDSRRTHSEKSALIHSEMGNGKRFRIQPVGCDSSGGGFCSSLSLPWPYYDKTTIYDVFDRVPIRVVSH